MGPRLNTGKNVSAPRISTTPVSSTVNSDVFTGNVPGDGGTLFFCARFPASATTGISIRNRPASMLQPSTTLYHQVLALSPAKAEPLLPVADEKAQRISLNPCGPPLLRADRPMLGDSTKMAVNVRMINGKMSTYSIDIFTSYASIFLPRYSGVRPTISPAMKTASTTKINMP